MGRTQIRKRLALGTVGALVVAAGWFGAAGGAAKTLAAGCTWPAQTQPFAPFGDTGRYFVAPGGNFESGTGGWTLTGGASIGSGNETAYVGSRTDSRSLALPTTSAVATTPTICVTTQSPTFRLFVKNNGNLGMIDGQLAVYVNFTGADGRPQQVKIAGLTVKSTSWTLSQPISFIQYISTPLKSGYANVSFTLKPNDNHGNWQLDDLYIDPYKCG